MQGDSQTNEGWLAFGPPYSSLERNKEEEEEEEDLMEREGLLFILGARRRDSQKNEG
jgi:hypothetical protein